jgi:hypothetical protein
MLTSKCNFFFSIRLKYIKCPSSKPLIAITKIFLPDGAYTLGARGGIDEL